jgi:hypothetical protein
LWQLWWVAVAVLAGVTVMVLVMVIVVAVAEYRQQSTNWEMKQFNLF